MNQRRGMWRGAAIVAVAGALSACSLGPKQTEQPASYDLGPPRAVAANPAIAVVLALPDVTAPAWLSGNGIVYRLSYDNASRAHAYTQSRWTAPPPALLTQRIRSRFAAAAAGGIVTGIDGVRADYLLRIELEDFSQAFDAPASSRGVVQARATLVSLATRTLVAQRDFAMERPAPTADAAGGVAALTGATEELVESLLGWTAERLKAQKAK